MIRSAALTVMAGCLFCSLAVAQLSRPDDVHSMTAPPALEAELQLVQRARRLISAADRWNHADTGTCPVAARTFSAYCALAAAAGSGANTEALAAAQQEARLAIWDLVVSKEYGHPLTDYNNDPMIGFADIQRLFRWLETRIRFHLRNPQAARVPDDDSQANPPASKTDLAIARKAQRLLATPATWNRHDNRDCLAGARTYSFFCALVEASDRVTANFEIRGAAMQEARFVVDALANGRKFPHRLMGFNNDPGTTFEDIRQALRPMEDRLRNRLAQGK